MLPVDGGDGLAEPLAFREALQEPRFGQDARARRTPAAGPAIRGVRGPFEEPGGGSDARQRLPRRAPLRPEAYKLSTGCGV